MKSCPKSRAFSDDCRTYWEMPGEQRELLGYPSPEERLAEGGEKR
jgi:hypothetical protein